MAQIRVVEKRSNLGWLWGVIGLVVIAALVWFFILGGRTATSGGEVAPSTPPTPAATDSTRQRKDTVLRPRVLEAMPVAEPLSARRARVRAVHSSV